MFDRLKNTKTLKLFAGTILGAIAGMLLPETNAMHLSIIEGVMAIIAACGMLTVRDGIAKK